MSVGDVIAAANNRFLLRIRHPDAWRAAEQPGDGFAALQGHKYCLLTTFRRSGEPVPTPVWFGSADGCVYVRTEAASPKVKRIRSNPRVLVGPCGARGRPLGPMGEGRARVLSRSEEARAEAALEANYGLGRKLYEGAGTAMGVDLVYIEISPTEGAR